MVEIIGQALGIVAVLLAFLSYQMSTQKKLLVVQLSVSATIAVHYGLIGAYSGMTLNVCAIVRNLVYYYKKTFVPPAWTAVICVMMALVSMISWSGPISLLPLAGLIINTVFLSVPNPQNLRKSILVSSPCILIYNVVVFSLGGIFMEAFAIVSAIIGLIRFRKKTEPTLPTEDRPAAERNDYLLDGDLQDQIRDVEERLETIQNDGE